MYIADLHIHSRFSRATSRDCDLAHLDWWARRKGIRLLGTGDFTHPAWRAELKEQLVPAGEGVYRLREELCLPGAPAGEPPLFIITGEISSIYKRAGKTRKVHNLILLPDLEAAEELSARLEAIGNIHSDGRPILGLDSRDLLELTLQACPGAELIPAHIWTPHFAMFGAFSGFDTIEACFGDLKGQIHAVETGLSSDPPMNWRVSALDGLTLVSNSDAHSPAKLGREANLLETACTYPGLVGAIRSGEGFLGTIEFFPEEGKYHLDGHRNCGVCLTPAETIRLGGVCPVCHRKLTIGVEHRVEELADRPAGAKPTSVKPFESLAPLPEVIAASAGGTPTGRKTQALYERLLLELGPEFEILRSVAPAEIERIAGPCVAEGIRRLRAGEVERRPGYDGAYGTITLLRPEEREQAGGQLSLFGIERPEKKKNTGKPLFKPVAAPAGPEETAAAQALNPAQQAAVMSAARMTAVIAGPGTGKTKTLVARIAYLIEERGVSPGEITAVTFTNQAAGEMRRRLEARLGGRRAVSRMTIGTFHAICLKLLGNVSLIGASEALGVAEEVLRANGVKMSARGLLQAVSRVKNGASLEQAGLEEALYTAYCAALQRLGALDFDDLLLEALRRQPGKEQRFSHILVDEFQDINDTQLALFDHWSSGAKSLFAIGDPDQAIYGFRGAGGRCFERLLEKYPDTRVIRLEENYRSAPEVLDAALRVIEKNSGEKRVLHPHCRPGKAVRMVEAADDFSEAVFIAKEIGRMTGGVDMLEAQKLGAAQEARSFSEIAVLCRTHHQIELIERCLRHDDIPCVISGREAFLDEKEVRAALGFFRFLQAPGDAAALENALRLIWDCPADLIEKARRALQDADVPDFPGLRAGFAGHGHLLALLDRAEEWLPLIAKEKPYRLVARWETLYGSTPALEKLRHTAVFYPDFSALWNALTLGEEADLCREAGRGMASGAVRLMTLHGAKGLEFPAVFIAGLKEGVLPLSSPGKPADPEEERRLFFVGITRAREELILTGAPALSCFLDDLPQQVIWERAQPPRERPAEQLTFF